MRFPWRPGRIYLYNLGNHCFINKQNCTLLAPITVVSNIYFEHVLRVLFETSGFPYTESIKQATTDQMAWVGFSAWTGISSRSSKLDCLWDLLFNNGSGTFLRGVRRLKRESNHSHLVTTYEIRGSLPKFSHASRCLVYSHRKNITFTLQLLHNYTVCEEISFINKLERITKIKCHKNVISNSKQLQMDKQPEDKKFLFNQLKIPTYMSIENIIQNSIKPQFLSSRIKRTISISLPISYL